MVCYGIFWSGQYPGQYQNIGRVPPGSYWSQDPHILVVGKPVLACARGVCTGSLKWRVGEKGKMRCNNDIKHVVKKLTIAISNRNIDELRELAC